MTTSSWAVRDSGFSEATIFYVFGYEDSGDTVATISATRIFIIQLCAGMKKAHDVMVMSLKRLVADALDVLELTLHAAHGITFNAIDFLSGVFQLFKSDNLILCIIKSQMSIDIHGY